MGWSGILGSSASRTAFWDPRIQLASPRPASPSWRRSQIASTLGNTKRFVTIGVTDTAEGVRIISSSENELRPAAKNVLQDGEIAVEGPGHAEVTGVNAARDRGLTPIGTAASRPICPDCAQFLQ